MIKEINNLIGAKLRLARKVAGISPDDIKNATRMYQGDISNLELGKKKFIPTDYLKLLVRFGVNVDALLNDDVSIEQFSDMLKGADVRPSEPSCPKCEEKDRRIEDLKEHISTLNDLIRQLRTNDAG